MNLAPQLDEKLRSKEHSNILFSADQVHDKEMIDFAKVCATEIGYDLMDGSYAYWPLPQYETSADIQYILGAGVTVTGASTIPEQMAAFLLGMKGIGFAVVTNPATGL